MKVVKQEYGPGDWPVSYSACEDLKVYLDDVGKPEQQDLFEGMATGLLWEWTNRSFGIDIVSLRPEPVSAPAPSTYQYIPRRVTGYAPVHLGGVLLGITCGQCHRSECRCSGGTSAIDLPGRAHRIHRVRIDGKDLPAEAYRMDNRRTLRLTGKSGNPLVFPSVQDLSRDASEEGTWEIVYSRGVPVPEGGQVAAGVLALELAKAACSDRDCALPARLQSVTRQGVTVQIQDDFEDMQEGRTGIWLVDSWVSSIRKPSQSARAYNPDAFVSRRFQ